MTTELPPRLRRTLELVYAVEGVTAARIWHWGGSRVSVGIRGAVGGSTLDLVHRVQKAVASIQEPDETWDFGLLDDDLT